MRALTEYELILVAGGTSSSGSTGNDEIVVTATSYGWFSTSHGGDDPTPTGNGSLGGTGYTYGEWMASNHIFDGATDYLAQQIANLIKLKPDWNAREYGGVIYMDTGGNLKMSPLTTGMTVAEAIAAGLPAPQTTISVPSDSLVILGVVHSHPDIGYSNAEDLLNRYPSDYAGGGDYHTFDTLVGSGMIASDPRFANTSMFSQYILGPDGVLREFNMSEGRVNATNDTVPDRSNLAFDRGS